MYAVGSQIVIAILTGVGVVWAIHASLGRELRGDIKELSREMARLGERMERVEEGSASFQ